MQANGGLFLFLFRLFARGAAGEKRKREQIDVEWLQASLHILRRIKNESQRQSKELMGQQLNKVEKRQRRKAYLKRKTVAAKAVKTKKKTA